MPTLSMPTPIVAAIIGAVVAAIGWVVANNFARSRDIESRQSQAHLRYLERQIEELYGPLEGLLSYASTIYELEQTRKQYRPAEQANRDSDVIRYFIEQHYIPINQQIVTLLRTKAHLMVNSQTPESFKRFLAYAAKLECTHNLWRHTELHSFFIPGYEYPANFDEEVKATLHKLRENHTRLIRNVIGRDDINVKHIKRKIWSIPLIFRHA
ncbi:hypothetical protein BZZ01_11075 [Nostocales cyanobacterium HT-58-2]|nr:hypothetical protein BZZ01_11075 [Nostocales cyanobacterium HT-58-2]